MSEEGGFYANINRDEGIKWSSKIPTEGSKITEEGFINYIRQVVEDLGVATNLTEARVREIVLQVLAAWVLHGTFTEDVAKNLGQHDDRIRVLAAKEVLWLLRADSDITRRVREIMTDVLRSRQEKMMWDGVAVREIVREELMFLMTESGIRGLMQTMSLKPVPAPTADWRKIADDLAASLSSFTHQTKAMHADMVLQSSMDAYNEAVKRETK